MATYIERYDLVDDPSIQKKIQMAVWVHAAWVLSQGPAQDGNKKWARSALKVQMQIDDRRRLAILLMADPTIGPIIDTATDAQFQDAVVNHITDVIKGWGGPI
jgi:hypothetical protein